MCDSILIDSQFYQVATIYFVGQSVPWLFFISICFPLEGECESWLHKLLCLDATNYILNIDGGCEYKFLYFNIRSYYK